MLRACLKHRHPFWTGGACFLQARTICEQFSQGLAKVKSCLTIHPHVPITGAYLCQSCPGEFPRRHLATVSVDAGQKPQGLHATGS